MKNYIFIVLVLSFCLRMNAQVGINTATPDVSSMLDISSTDKGLLIPRMSSIDRAAILSPANGLQVYDTTVNQLYYYNGTTWTALYAGSNYWSLTGVNLYNNSGTNVGVGTTTPADKFHVLGNFRVDTGKIDFRNTGNSVFVGEAAGTNDDFTTNNNVGIGYYALNANITGASNTAVGYGALRNSTASNNSAYGFESLLNSTTGIQNSAFGYSALRANTTGNQNTAFGYYALANSTSSQNTAFGAFCLQNATGFSNTSVGYDCLSSNTSGGSNFALGYQALRVNTTGNNNIAIGYRTLVSNTTSNHNLAIGNNALFNSTASGNVALGNNSGNNTTTGNNNVFIGYSAGNNNTTGATNTQIGYGSGFSNVTGNANVYLGYRAGGNSIGGGNVFIGYSAGENEATSSKLYIDNSNTTTPLIYGDFGTDVLRINGTLNIKNLYSFPTTDGAANSILQTDGAGIVSWVNPNSLNITENDPKVSSVTNNTIPKWNGTTLTDGIVYDNGTNVGIGNVAPTSLLDVNGASGFKIIKQSGVGTVTLDNSATVWYFTGTEDVVLPIANTCPNRLYRIVNRNTINRTISTFIDLSGNSVVNINPNSCIEVISDGTNWLQIN